MPHIDTDTQKIDELLSRSVDSVYPTRDDLRKKLLRGEQLRVYMGIDPTSTYVHLGHSTNYIVLRRFHELGHKVIVLIGDFTAMIGDPSDKTATRVRLSRDEVIKNVETYKEQIGKILDFGNTENPIEFRFNAEWLSKLTLEELADLASHFTVQQMLERDVFERRLTEKKPLYVHEFFYPLMQGYDSVALEADVEVGGTDQTFNMLAGRTLVKRYLGKEKNVLTTTLLENPKTGEKLMSKSEGTGVGLNEDPQTMFGKVMALPDESVIQCFVDCTTLPAQEIETLKKKQKSKPKEVKERLGKEIVQMYHSEEEAQKSWEEFGRVFAKGGVPSDVSEVTAAYPQERLYIILSDTNLVSSNSEARRLIEDGAVEVDGNTITDPHQEINLKNGVVIRVGKHRFIRIQTKK